MEKRVLIAVVLSFLVLYGYQAMFVKQPPPRPRQAAAGSQQAGSQPSGTSPGAAPGTTSSTAPAATTPTTSGGAATAAVTAAEPVAATVTEPAEREVVIDTRVVRAVISNRGGVIKSWRLKHFPDANHGPQELIPQGLPAGSAQPLTLRVDDAAATERLKSALFRMDAGGSSVDATRAAVAIVLEYQDQAGLQARKEISFTPDSYIIHVTASVVSGGRPFNPTIVWGPALGDSMSGETSRYTQKPEGILFREGKVERLAAKALAAQPVQEGQFRLVGVDDQYFLSAVLTSVSARAEFQPMSVPVPGGKPGAAADLVSWSVRVAKSATDVRLFIGPKDFDLLKGIDPELARVIDFGWFSVLAVPLLGALKSINGYVGNYGWSIIILTLLINILMFPLRHKSVVSMRKMQEIQPEIKAIQDRYKNLKTTDPARQKMNTELMNLYRERGVNPASGCLPMLLTMPVLFAFYSLLSKAIEIRGAPWGLWIKDLSAADPYYVTPIVMGLTMLWQQKITPSTVDPAQQRMMMIMPLVFLFMFLWAPSGLVIYWLASNLMAIGQQYATNRIIGPPSVRRPAAERRLKTAGGGKSDGAK
jgi:YidC/Oxa1 family membrane protein insertase